jgi:hypothetical protein
MIKRQDNLEKMIALALLADAVALFFGEALRDVTCDKIESAQLQDVRLVKGPNPACEQQKCGCIRPVRFA